MPESRILQRLALLTSMSFVAALAAAQTPAPAATHDAPAAAAAPAAPVLPTPPAAPAAPAVDEAASYSIGLTFGTQLHGTGVDQNLSLDAVTRGLKDGLAGKVLTDEDRQRAMQFVKAGREAAAVQNHAAAIAFLAQNRSAKDIVTTSSGLQYQVFEAGDAKAASPTLKDRVTVNYRGRLLDGTEFDSSDRHKQAATFGLNGVLKGWREALQLMKPGAKWRLFVPPELGYDLSAPPGIPSGSLLIFDVELLKVEPPAPMSAPDAKDQKKPKPAVTRKPVAAKPVQ